MTNGSLHQAETPAEFAPAPPPSDVGPAATSARSATGWYLASRPAQSGDGGVEYTVFVDGRLITAGHPTGEAALAEAERILAAGPPLPKGGSGI